MSFFTILGNHQKHDLAMQAQDAVPCAPGLADLLKDLKNQGDPALHHSVVYRAIYQPGYRVFLESYL